MSSISLQTIKSVNPKLVSTAVEAIESTPFDFQGLALASRGDLADSLNVSSFEVEQEGEIVWLSWIAGGNEYHSNITGAFV